MLFFALWPNRGGFPSYAAGITHLQQHPAVCEELRQILALGVDQHLGTHVVLFVRETPHDDIGAAPFLCLGQATYAEHRGDRPIAITWRLQRPMPGETFRIASVVA